MAAITRSNGEHADLIASRRAADEGIMIAGTTAHKVWREQVVAGVKQIVWWRSRRLRAYREVY